MGALIMRAVIIAIGVATIARFHWIIYVFGLLLDVTGVNMTLLKKRTAFNILQYGLSAVLLLLGALVSDI